MEDRQIWLKPKPTHIDEYFEDFINYLKTSDNTTDTLYVESVRLLKLRIEQLVELRTETPVYRQDKTPESLRFNTRLCGAWLLAVKDASSQERRQVLLTMINCLVRLSLQSTVSALNSTTYAYKSVPEMLGMALKLASCDTPALMPFAWNDLIDFSLDMFVIKFVKMQMEGTAANYFEGKGLLVTHNGQITLATYSKHLYDKKYLQKNICDTPLLPEYGFTVSTEQNLQVKDSQKGDVAVVEEFVDDILHSMNTFKSTAQERRLLSYADDDYVPVEVTEVNAQRIVLKTIDPAYTPMTGQLVFEQNLKIFSKVYPVEVWAKVMKPGDRFNVNINTSNNTFSITNLFVDFIYDNVSLDDDIYDAHNRKVQGGWLKLREFWTDKGFMVFVDITAEEDEELDLHNRNAGIVITEHGKGQYRGCLYGRIEDYEVEKTSILREETCPAMLKRFIAEHSELKMHERGGEQEKMAVTFIKEYCDTLNMLQSREVNPMLRYRILCVMRILSTLTGNERDGNFCQFIAKYIKTLILFAKADADEGDTVVPIEAPEDLKDAETATNDADILKILACFAKDYDATSSILDPYIENGNETLCKTASLVQAYNRLFELLEKKTLRGIKKQILNLLSVVADGDSTLELSNELEGIFGDEDDMKEFKSSFFEAPANAQDNRQFYNIFRGICAMMNNRGGVLYLGVNDKGVPVGVANDLETLARQHNVPSTLDAYMLHISRMGEQWFGETYWKYVTLKPIREHNVVSINIEPYPYDIVRLKDGKVFLRKNNASAPITDEATIEDIRRRRLENRRKTDDKTIIMQDAIQKERKVRLVGYKSSSSGTISNRIVEPFRIDSNEYVHCYEPESGKVKIFRISRADKIALTDEPWDNKARHKVLDMDPFHLTGETKIYIKLRLKLQAKNAIEEYYPGISRYIRQYDANSWMLDTFTYDYYPLMVFYLSHAKYVEIVEAKGLKEAVVDYVKQYLHLEK